MNISLFGSRKDMARSTPFADDRTIAVFGAAETNLSQIRLPEAINLSALAMFGSVKYIVPPGTDVVFRGFALFGSQEFKTRGEGPAEQRGSVIYLNAVALFGSIEVIEAV